MSDAGRMQELIVARQNALLALREMRQLLREVLDEGALPRSRRAAAHRLADEIVVAAADGSRRSTP